MLPDAIADLVQLQSCRSTRQVVGTEIRIERQHMLVIESYIDSQCLLGAANEPSGYDEEKTASPDLNCNHELASSDPPRRLADGLNRRSQSEYQCRTHGK